MEELQQKLQQELQQELQLNYTSLAGTSAGTTPETADHVTPDLIPQTFFARESHRLNTTLTMVLISQLLDFVKTLEIRVLDFAIGNLSAVRIAIQSFYLLVVTVIAILVLILIIADIESINRRIIKIVTKILTALTAHLVEF